MGVAGAVIGGALLGMGAASMSQKKANYSYASDVHSTMTPSKPTTPEPPSSIETNPDETSAGSNALMEAEREKERQQAALRKQNAREVFTSGLGAAGMADTAKKSLLGG